MPEQNLPANVKHHNDYGGNEWRHLTHMKRTHQVSLYIFFSKLVVMATTVSFLNNPSKGNSLVAIRRSELNSLYFSWVHLCVLTLKSNDVRCWWTCNYWQLIVATQADRPEHSTLSFACTFASVCRHLRNSTHCVCCIATEIDANEYKLITFLIIAWHWLQDCTLSFFPSSFLRSLKIEFVHFIIESLSMFSAVQCVAEGGQLSRQF